MNLHDICSLFLVNIINTFLCDFLGIDALHGGIATHYCHSTRIPDLEYALTNLKNVDDIEEVLIAFCPKIESKFSLAKHLDQINKCFNASTVEEILSNLENDGTDWAKQTIKVNYSDFEIKYNETNCLRQ